MKEYQIPEISMILLANEDVITTSGATLGFGFLEEGLGDSKSWLG